MKRDDEAAADALLRTSRSLVAIAIRGLQAGSVRVTVAQHRTLVLLEEHGSLTVNEIAQHLGVDQSNASRHCVSLEQRGLVDRIRATQDGRSVEVALTAAGSNQVLAVRRARRREIAEVLSRMSHLDARGIVEVCTAFNEAASSRSPSR